ncbi:MAG: class I SAM-dependent methyltransferase, partial [Syntrophales bacterium]|nr:class I SAM-dependent methyltransferase [Syntrophales bacterium]
LDAGMTILDFGCGPGGFTLAAARLVGPEGLVYAADIHPLAIKSVQKAANKQRLNNIRTIFGERTTDIPRGSVDIVLLYDVLHGVPEPDIALMKLHRTLKPEGMLSVSDHHLQGDSLQSTVTRHGLFRLVRSMQQRQFLFRKTETKGGDMNFSTPQIKPMG